MTKDCISILIPTYARTTWLQEALWCAIRQTVPTRIIVLNDCPRQTLLCEHPLVTIVNLPERMATLGQKRNALLQMADSEWVVWLDDDDWLLPWYVEDLLAFPLPSFDTVLTNRCWHAIGGGGDGCVEWSQAMAIQPMAVRLQAAKDCGGFPALDAEEDRVFLERMLVRGRICSLVTVPGYCYRWDNGTFHVSGSGDLFAGKALGQDAEMRFNQGLEPSGRVILSPSLRFNYFKNFPDQECLSRSLTILTQREKTDEMERYLAFAGREIKVIFPQPLEHIVDIVCVDLAEGRKGQDVPALTIRPNPETGRYDLSFAGLPEKNGIVLNDLGQHLLNTLLDAFLSDCADGLALNAGAVGQAGRAVLLPGTAGVGKTLLAAWLLGRSYQYLGDDCLLVRDREVQSWRHPLSLKKGAELHLASLAGLETQRDGIIEGTLTHLVPWRLLAPAETNQTVTAPAALVFPEFRPGSDISLEALPPAQAGLLLMATVANGRNLPGHGFPQVARLCRNVPALRLIYGDFSQLDGVLDRFLTIILDQQLSPVDLATLVEPFNRHRHLEELAASSAQAAVKAAQLQKEFKDKALVKYPVPSTSPKGPKKKLTIGMATYDDYDGVYFSIQSLRLYHPEVAGDIEILVVDNHPDGPCAASLKELERSIPNFRYVPELAMTGTAVRDLIFREAGADYVLCLDCHVLIVPGALRKLLDYLAAHADCQDLLQGPLVYDDLVKISTHFKPEWRQGMYGVWETDERGLQADAAPFAIPMQGLGLFCCRRDAWPGFNPRFRGFGGEEGYIHEKIRQKGGRVLCLPFLRWLHRFGRPLGVPYQVNWKDRIWNYMIGFQELGLDCTPIIEHFADHLGPDASQILAEIEQKMLSPFFFFEAIYCITMDTDSERWAGMQARLKALGIAERVRVFPAIATPDNHHIGCALSHRRIIADARRQGLQNVLVFEDDAIFFDDTPACLASSIHDLRGQDWHVFYLGGHAWGQTFPFVDGCTALQRPMRLTCTHALAYNAAVFDILLETLPEEIDSMRQWLGKFHGFDQYLSRLEKLFLAYPVIASQPALLPVEKQEHRHRFTLGELAR